VKPAVAAGALMLMPGSVRADGVADARKALESNRHEEARDAYRGLAGKSRLPERKARFHLGEATAAYRGGDFKDARTAYSRAMLSEDPAIATNSHLGMGNTLFQLGWRLLAGESYPTNADKLPDMEFFDTKVGELLAKPLEDGDEADDDGQTAPGYTRIKSIITNWSDAVRHYDSALASQPDNPQARHNRDMTMDYLKRLQELLEEEEQATEESMPQPQPGEGEPQQGEGQPKEEPGDEKGKGDEPKPEGEAGRDGDDKNQDSSGDQEDKDKDSSGEKTKPKDPSEKKDDKGKEPEDPDETPEERARRLLKENADLERGPLTPGRREFMSPEKDW
jgi:tetratricopeptide (TPR) repeat protein